MPSVIGVFDTQEDAESARESLICAGFDEDDVRVQSHRSIKDLGGGLQSRSDEEEEGFMSRVGHFFSDLLGGSDDGTRRHAEHYAEHVRRGGSVVVVKVDDESRVDEARSALATAGAVDIDRRTEAWRVGMSGSSYSANSGSALGSGMDPDDEMAYRYGSTLRNDRRYAGRSSWDDVEADARAVWSERNPNSNWERTKAAVRNGWESMAGRR